MPAANLKFGECILEKEGGGCPPHYLLYACTLGVSWAASFILLTGMAWGYQNYRWRKEADPKNTEKAPISQTFLHVLLRLSFGLGNVVNVLFGNGLYSSIAIGAILGVLFSIYSWKQNLPYTLFRTSLWTYCSIVFCTIILIFVIYIRPLNMKGFALFETIIEKLKSK